MHLQGRAQRRVLSRGLCSASRTVWLHLLVSALCETARPANKGTARGSPHRARRRSDQGLQGWGCHTGPQALTSHCPAALCSVPPCRSCPRVAERGWGSSGVCGELAAVLAPPRGRESSAFARWSAGR